MCDITSTVILAKEVKLQKMALSSYAVSHTPFYIWGEQYNCIVYGTNAADPVSYQIVT